MSKKEKAGTVGWIDLTIPDADNVRDVYKRVADWGKQGRYCIIEYPAGAVAALFEPAE